MVSMWFRFQHSEFYYHLRSTVKRDRFYVKVYFSNVDGLASYLSRLTMKHLQLGHEIDNHQNFNILIQSDFWTVSPSKLVKLFLSPLKNNIFRADLTANSSKQVGKSWKCTAHEQNMLT